MSFIVQSKGAKFSSNTVVAPTGHSRTHDGHIVRDGTPSPEMGPIEHAYHFATHRAAARVASKLAFPVIREMPEADIKQKSCQPDLGGQDTTEHNRKRANTCQ